MQYVFVLFLRNPEQSYAEYSSQPQPQQPPRRLTPQQEEQRRLQESNVQKHIREQQQRSLQRQYNQAGLAYQQTQGSRYPQPINYQPAGPAGQQQQPQPQTYEFQPPPQPQLVYQQQPQYEPQPTAPPQYQQFAPEDQQYVLQPSGSPRYSQYESSNPPQSSLFSPEQPRSNQPQYYQQTPQVPKKFSYSQVQFGTSEIARESLEPKLAAIQKRLQKYPPQQKVQQLVYSPPPNDDYAEYRQPTPQQHAPSPPQTPTIRQHPEQYLIETTKPEQNHERVVSIPRQRASKPPPAHSHYVTAPTPSYDEQSLYQFYQQNSPLLGPAPSHSSIYVQTAGRSDDKTPEYYSQSYRQEPEIRIQTPQGHRPLTQKEINALVESGFSVSPLALSQKESIEISPSSGSNPKPQFHRSSGGKRQSKYDLEGKSGKGSPKRVPRPVPLTEDERKLLAEQGIRNLYRVESAESQNAPVTYVLALDNTSKERESSKSV